MTDAVIKTNNVSKKYGNDCVVSNINLTVKSGDIYGLVGKNGAGKTTIFKIISGLTIPSSGTLELFGSSTDKELSSARRRVGCIIEMPYFFSNLSARKNLEYYRIQRGIAGKKCVDEVLELVELADTGNKQYKDFSLGMKQRLGLALALLGSPDLLILDEPINGLDPVAIIKFRELLRRLNLEKNITIIISSHILGELSQIATKYGFIDGGNLLEEISAVEMEEKCKKCFKLKVTDTSAAVLVIENILGSRKYEVLNDNNIKVYDFIDNPQGLTKSLIDSGVGILSVTQEETSLEDYFMGLIGGK